MVLSQTQSICWDPASTRQHLQHPLNRVRHLGGALCNLRACAFERAALTYLQMALIRLACLFKHQKQPRQSCRETGRRSQIAGRDKSSRRISAILHIPAATVRLRESQAGDRKDNQTQTEHKSGRRWQHAPAVQPKTKVWQLLGQPWILRRGAIPSPRCRSWECLASLGSAGLGAALRPVCWFISPQRSGAVYSPTPAAFSGRRRVEEWRGGERKTRGCYRLMCVRVCV